MDTEVLVDDEQSEELTGIVEEIEKTCKGELDEVFKEADSHSCGEPIREVWENDKHNLKAQFFKDQQSNRK